LRTISHIFGSVLPFLLLAYLVSGNFNLLFTPRRVSPLTESDFQILSKNYFKHHAATIATLEESFIACLPSSIDIGSAKFYAETFADSIIQGVEFRSQPGLPGIGSSKREEMEAKYNINFAESMKKKLIAKMAALPSLQQQQLIESSDAIAGQRVKVVNCATTGAISKMSNNPL
jgi:hypothetical protein